MIYNQSPLNVILFGDSFSSTLVTTGEIITPLVPFPTGYFLFGGVDQSGSLVDKCG